VLVDPGLCSFMCYTVISWYCAVGCAGFRCHVMSVSLGVGGVSGSGVRVAGGWVQVLTEKIWYMTRCRGL